jgi:hypothetical protein
MRVECRSKTPAWSGYEGRCVGVKLQPGVDMRVECSRDQENIRNFARPFSTENLPKFFCKYKEKERERDSEGKRDIGRRIDTLKFMRNIGQEITFIITKGPVYQNLSFPLYLFIQ